MLLTFESITVTWGPTMWYALTLKVSTSTARLSRSPFHTGIFEPLVVNGAGEGDDVVLAGTGNGSGAPAATGRGKGAANLILVSMSMSISTLSFSFFTMSSLASSEVDLSAPLADSLFSVAFRSSTALGSEFEASEAAATVVFADSDSIWLTKACSLAALSLFSSSSGRIATLARALAS